MVEHPDFLNVRKLVVLFALGPVALLLLFIAIDVAVPKIGGMQASEVACVKTTMAGVGGPVLGSECRE